MVAGVTPGLQNRRAASSMLPVCSTHTRFRQFSTTRRLRNHSEISSPGKCHANDLRVSLLHLICHHVAVDVHGGADVRVTHQFLLDRD